MNSTVFRRTVGWTIAAAAVATLGAGPVQAADDPSTEEPISRPTTGKKEISADSDSPTSAAALNLERLSCGGTTSQDSVDASYLNPLLNNKMAGHLDAYNLSCARKVVQATDDRGLSRRAAEIAVAVIIVETAMQNLNGGDLDSVGLFQQRNSWGTYAERTNPTIATNKFLAAMETQYPNDSWETANPGVVAQNVQRSAYPDRYSTEMSDAVKIATRLWTAGDSSRPVRDYNGDGRGDLFARKPDGTYVFYRGYEGGKYGSATVMNGGWNNFNLVEGVGDANGDRRPDVVARSSAGDLYLYRGYEGGAFGSKALISGGWDNFNVIEGVGDVTGNGTQDLFVRRTDGTALLYRGDGHGKFNSPIEISGGWNIYNRIEGVGDVTGEGVPDLVARNAEGELYLYRGYRSGKFGTRTLISGGWNNFNLIEGVGDATGNGTADLFVRRPDGTALIYRGDGEGKFNNPITINGGWDNFNLITQ